MPSKPCCLNCRAFRRGDFCVPGFHGTITGECRHEPPVIAEGRYPFRAHWPVIPDAECFDCDKFRNKGSIHRREGAPAAPGEKGVEGEMLSPTPPYREGEPLKEKLPLPHACARTCEEGMVHPVATGAVPPNKPTYLFYGHQYGLADDFLEKFLEVQDLDLRNNNPNHYWQNRGDQTIGCWAVFLRNLATDRLLQNKWRRFLGLPELPREENRPVVETVNQAEREILERTKDEW